MRCHQRDYDDDGDQGDSPRHGDDHALAHIRSFCCRLTYPQEDTTTPRTGRRQMTAVPAHDRKITRSYIVHYPDHEPREDDPHYADFSAYRRRTAATAQCAMGVQRGDFSDCSLDKPLELHHSHLEFALANEVDLTWLERDYPGISDASGVGAWIESAQNLTWLCERCHRGQGGVHSASAADWEAEKYVRNLISGE